MGGIRCELGELKMAKALDKYRKMLEWACCFIVVNTRD